jgi:hypothetical protein
VRNEKTLTGDLSISFAHVWGKHRNALLFCDAMVCELFCDDWIARVSTVFRETGRASHQPRDTLAAYLKPLGG